MRIAHTANRGLLFVSQISKKMKEDPDIGKSNQRKTSDYSNQWEEKYYESA
jgi:hypothetical protein